jgi:hypothetical protein
MGYTIRSPIGGCALHIALKQARTMLLPCMCLWQVLLCLYKRSELYYRNISTTVHQVSSPQTPRIRPPKSTIKQDAGRCACDIVVGKSCRFQAIKHQYVSVVYAWRPPDSITGQITSASSNGLSQRDLNIPATIYVPDDDPQKAQHIAQLGYAWTDAIQLAALTHLIMRDCEATFIRYFEPDDGDFVRSIFGAVAHFRNPQNLDPSDPNNWGSIISNGYDQGALQKFNKLTISYGDHPDIPADERYCEQSANPSGQWDEFAWIWQPEELEDRAIINV